MSHNFADLSTLLPPEFLTPDMNPNHLPPYDFASSSSTESESDEDDVVSGLTRHFTRSVSFQDRPKTPYYHPQNKKVFSSSPESTLNWNVPGHTTPFAQPNENSLDLIYAAAEQVARMKMVMNMNMKMKANSLNDAVFPNGVPLKPSFSHHHHLPPIFTENEELFRQQLRRKLAGIANYDCGGRCGTGGPLGFRQAAWLPKPVENQRRLVPSVLAGVNGGCGRTNAVVKKERAGTGVFLPRNYCNVPPESKKKQAGLTPSFNKNMDPTMTQMAPQTNIHGGFIQQYPLQLSQNNFKRDELVELVMARRNAVILAQQRRVEERTGQAEVVLPQEWTY